MNINLKTMAMLHCGWQGSVITVKRDSGQVRVETLSHTYDKYQAKTSKASHNLPLSKSSKCLKCEAITDLCTGWTAPHLLVSHVPAPQALSYTHELLAYSPGDGVFTEQGLLFEVDEDDLPTETDGEGEGYHLLDGPTVLWKQGATVHIVHGPNLEQVCVTVRRPGVAVERVRKMWCVQGRAGGGGSEGGNVCVLLMLQLVLKEGGGNRYREFGEREWMCLEVTLKDGSRQMDCFQTLEAKRIPNLIPADYGYIASCVVPYWCSEMDDGYRGGLVERLGFAVGTEYQQVVLVEGGRMKQVISLQDTPQHIVPLKGIGDKMEVAVSYSDRSLSVYEVTETGHKDRGRWRGVSGCVAGDFAKLGHSQFLILPEKESSGRFYLKGPNILSVNPPSESDENESVSEGKAPESLLNVLKALQLKRHTGAAHLLHHQLSLQHKHSLLSKSLTFMESLGKDGSSVDARPDPGLVCLIAGKVKPEPATPLEGKERSDLYVLKVWQRFVASDSTWVVALLLRNDSQTDLTSVAASLLLESDHALPVPRGSTSRVVWREPLEPQVPAFLKAAATDASSPPKKRLRYEVVTSALQSPDSSKGAGLGQSSCCEPLQPDQVFCVGVAAKGVCPGARATVCGSWCKEGKVQTAELVRVQLDVRLVSTGELTVDEQCLQLWDGNLLLPDECKLKERGAQDLACLLATQSLTQVVLHTEYTHLSRLPSMIRARLPLPAHAIQLTSSQHHPPSAPSSVSTTTGHKVLEEVVLHIRLLSDYAIISILHKSCSDLQLVLKLLKECLPNDVHFSTMSESESAQQQALQQTLSCIRKEGSELAEKLKTAIDIGTSEAEERGEGVEHASVARALGDPRLACATDKIVKSL